jgi:hypothetical protein
LDRPETRVVRKGETFCSCLEYWQTRDQKKETKLHFALV